MRASLRIAVPALVLAAAAAFAEDAPKVALAPKFVKGAAAEYAQAVTSAQSVTMPNGMQQQQETTMERAWTQTVDSVADDGGATVTVKFGRIHGSATSTMGTLTFDSDAAAAAPDPSNPMAAMTGQFTKAFTLLAGKTATVKLAKDGTPGDVQGLDHVLDETAGGGGQMGGMGRQMGKAFASPEAVKGWLRLAHPKMPETPVGVGDTWTESWTQDAVAGRKMTITVTYKVTGVDAETVSVAMDGKMDLAAAATAPAGKDGEKGGTGGEGGGAAGGAGGAPGAPGAPAGKGGGPGGAAGGPGGPGGGRGGMGRMMEDATLEKGVMTGTGKVSRKDGMMVVADSVMNLVLKSAANGASMEQSAKSHVERKAAPAAPPPAPAAPTLPGPK